MLEFLLTSVLPWHPWAPPQMEALFGADYERITDDNAVDLEADVTCKLTLSVRCPVCDD